VSDGNVSDPATEAPVCGLRAATRPTDEPGRRRGGDGRSWWLFVALLPAPDLGLLGNLGSRRAGAVAYDLTHTYLPPVTLALVGVVTGSGLAVALALVWFAHIGMDRALGLGLQYPDGSGRTHLRETRQRRNGAGPGGGAWTG
jgi:hypothetical protein